MKKTNKNNNHKFLSKNYIKGAISGALALTILCSGVGVAAYSAGADNTAQALGVQTESTVEAVKKASTTKEALKKLSKNAKTVYLATAPDREGEAISWHLKELLALSDERARRVTFNEITKKVVTESIGKPRDIDSNLVDAQQARRLLDRLVGYKLSPLLWKKIRRGLSAGRVQSVATRMVVDRENEIRSFVSEEYWLLDAIFESEENAKFTARFYGRDDKKLELKSEDEVNAVINIGFNLSSDPRITASCSERPLCRSSLYLSISNIPFLVAIPNREMKPIIAGMLMIPSAKNIANTPPMRANGRFSRPADA